MRNDIEGLIDLIMETSQCLREWVPNPHATPGSIALTRVRLTTLKYISEREPVTMKELAGYLRVSPPSATILADALSAKGLIRRIVGKTDRRNVRLSITAKGRRALADGYRQMSEKVRLILMRLTPEERRQLERMLSRLNAAPLIKKTARTL